MKNNILVLGRGYLGNEFERHGFEVWGRDKFEATPDINYHLPSILSNYNVIVNCIGKTNTRWCEESINIKEMMFTNAELVRLLSECCSLTNKRFVHISTGCLYDDYVNENKEDSFVSAHCKYTVSKYVGEMYCNPNRDLILRPRLLFSDIITNKNLLCRMEEFESYTGNVLDSLTCTSTVVGATKALLENEQCGIFNVAQMGSATIAKIAQICGMKIASIHTAEQLRSRERMYLVNNVMNIDKLLKYYRPMDIETSVKLAYAELKK